MLPMLEPCPCYAMHTAISLRQASTPMNPIPPDWRGPLSIPPESDLSPPEKRLSRNFQAAGLLSFRLPASSFLLPPNIFVG
jgi:hypothetical protein